MKLKARCCTIKHAKVYSRDAFSSDVLISDNRSSCHNATPLNSESGVALILVTFIIALATILVVNLAYSTQLSARQNAGTLQSLQAEYLLKSAVNLARVLVKEDSTPDEDSRKDPWGKFWSGIAVPPELLGIDNDNVHVELEIRAEEAKIPLRAVIVPGQSKADNGWRDVITRLFRSRELAPGFDEDQEEVDQSGYYPNRHFNAQETTANLIDYMDSDKEPYSDQNFAAGIEGDSALPEDIFPNEMIKRSAELAAIPGFTAGRIRKIMPFVTCFGNSRININLAPKVVLRALSEQLGDAEIDAIINFRESEDGPFSAVNLGSQITKIIGDSVYQEISTRIGAQSRWFQVIAKVDSGNLVYYARAYISKGTAVGELPSIRSLELF